MALLLLSAVDARCEQNIARPEIHPYVDPAGGRESHQPIASQLVNEARVYDFYQRQADYYLPISAGELPKILPAFPGLDAGKHGHWGKHNQNNYEDGRWNDIVHGPLVTQVFFNQDIRVLKGMSIDLGNDVSTVFDPMALCFRSVWQDGFLKFHPFRWGSSRNAEAVGEIWFSDKGAKGWDGDALGVYHGHYRHKGQLVLAYRIGDTEVLDLPSSQRPVPEMIEFLRSFRFPKGTDGLRLRVGRAGNPGETWAVTSSGANSKIEVSEDRSIWLDTGVVGSDETIEVEYMRSKGKRRIVLAPEGQRQILVVPPTLKQLTEGGGLNFPKELKTPGSLGKPPTPDSPYVVDTLAVPFDNPYRSVMQLTGIAFNPDGSALVCTLAGDLWKVTGIDESLQSVTWKRYATGFNQPIGINIDKDGTFVLDRGQITRLHDFNGDDEADFYENYANDFGGYDRSHSHTFGLHRTADGSFTFVQREDILRTGPDRKTRQLAWGVRNCMGVGGSAELALVAPQEGTWTPASMIIEVNDGEFYGLPKAGDQNTNIATPLCYIPRGLDNSTGGIVQVKGDRWGPLADRFIGISYGSGSHYLILRDATGPRPQGATVPLEGDFLAGTMRGAFNPKDGQLYLVGLDGWGDYSTQDGCFHRVRYNGKPFRHPVGFRIHSNGIRIDFANQDVMPHNLVIVKPGCAEEVGTASFAMLNDPDAGEKHYIPGSDSVISHSFVVPAGSQHTLHLRAPEEPGDYPYICTFPGHWQAMRGVLRIRN